MLKHERLIELIDYDHKLGDFSWRESPCRWIIAGRECGYISKSHGYLAIGIDGKEYLAHRLAWLWMTGKWPKNKIDHIDRDKSNNKWENLREATDLQSVVNRGRRCDCTSGLKGVYFEKKRNKYSAQISINRKTIHLGRFDCPAAAHFAYIVEAHRNYGEYASGGF